MVSGNYQDSCAFLIHDVARLARKRFDDSVRDLGITQAKWRILASLRLRPGQTQSELAERLNLGKVPMGLALDWLESAGWVKREQDSNDRRARRASLTREAEPVTRTIQERFTELADNLLPLIGEDHIADFAASLERIRDSLAAKAAETPRAELTEHGYLSLLLDCARLLNTRFNARLAELGFTRNQWLVLNTVHQREGLRQVEVAELTELGPAPLGRLIDGLERDGWINRREDPGDRRAKRLFATPTTHDLINTMRARFEKLHAELLKPLSIEQRDDLVDALMRLRVSLLDTGAIDTHAGRTETDHGR